MHPESDEDSARILHCLRELHEAMIVADARKLAELITDDYALVHITGYRQPRAEWLDVIRNGQFSYHAITLDAATLAIQVNGKQAEVSGRGVFDASINGMRAPWRLEFVMSLLETAGTWRFQHSAYSRF